MARPTSGALKMQLCRQIHRRSRYTYIFDTVSTLHPATTPPVSRMPEGRLLPREQAGGTALGEAELEIDGLAAKSAQQERLSARLERLNAQVLEENEGAAPALGERGRGGVRRCRAWAPCGTPP